MSAVQSKPGPFTEIEAHARRIHELMCEANLIGGTSSTCSFTGWTADGRAVRHTIHVRGYERTGPTVEKERAALAKADEEGTYQGVRCACLQTGCRAGPGCPLYSVHCRSHIAFVTKAQEAAS
ncbi:hypothetical protein [Variovorax atrisoli]|uniref:hypothetical protein n=1 Tax=Variovorax atrisoli TaxID=3394203 RepID=UPI0016096EA3|nr:hypothetical protein [Variovorax sp. BK613]MBB3642587.1 hypothetical protein [Variovorax sp. BK613]